jgi:hypothetical protein
VPGLSGRNKLERVKNLNAASAALQLRPHEIEGIFMHDPIEFFGALMG